MTVQRLTQILACLFAAFALPVSVQGESGSQPLSFAQQVDLTPLNAVAVNHVGRVNSFESHASSLLSLVTGPRRIHGDSRAFTYLDLIFRPDVYESEPVIFVKNKLVRAQVAELLRDRLSDERMTLFQKKGLISRDMLFQKDVQQKLSLLAQDLIRTAKYVDQIETAINLARPDVLRGNLRVVPPASGSSTDPWLTPDEITAAAHQEFDTGIDGSIVQSLASSWSALESAWVDQNAPAVNEAVNRFVSVLKAHAQMVAQRNPDLYPSDQKLALESWYFRASNMTWVWLIYGFSVVPLLISVVYRWPAARWIGLSMFIIAFGFHTFALLLRYYVSGRWPNANMFEALTTAAWFGSAAAIVFEVLLRRSAMRNIVALGAAICSMVAFMAVHFLPLELTPNISNKMPVLHDVWLYIHTNVIIFSYALIGMAAVPAAIYLLHRAWRVLAGTYESPALEYARVGGAGSLILTGPRGEQLMAPEKSTFGQVLDGTTMVLMELAFVLLWTGLVMGAIWADHSWGRPWGWDPKEVFALNTFIIFLLLVHVRLKVKDKGLWTAMLAVLGAVVMIFNWVVINFTIAGLHSYA